MLSNKYKLVEKISEGSFGQIYKGQNVRTGEFVAVKVESNTTNKTLKNEARIYQYLCKKDGFPLLKWYETSENQNILVIELCGSSLLKLIEHYKVFSLKTVLRLGIQIIERIKVLHENLLIHRDIKPDNFLFGLNNNRSTNKLYLIDFGFCKRYSYDNKHIIEKNISKLIGTPNFVSLNIHNGTEPSRRDDVESCIYIIAYMLLGRLEWFDYSVGERMIILKKLFKYKEEVPSFIKIMLHYIHDIRFDEKPDYDYLINIMKKLFTQNGYNEIDKYEWEN